VADRSTVHEGGLSGSYYKETETLTHTGPVGSVKSLLKRTTGQQFRGMRK
jgi:hypothetical protein